MIESKCAVLHYINAVGCTISPVAALEWSAHAKAALMVSDGARVIQLHMRFDGYIEFHVMLWLVSGSSFALLGFFRRIRGQASKPLQLEELVTWRPQCSLPFGPG